MSKSNICLKLQSTTKKSTYTIASFINFKAANKMQVVLYSVSFFSLKHTGWIFLFLFLPILGWNIKWKWVIRNYWRDIKVEMAAGLRWIVNRKSDRRELSNGLEEMQTIKYETNPTCLLDSSETNARSFSNYDKGRVSWHERRNLFPVEKKKITS